MPDFNSVLNVNTLLNGGALVLVAMSFVWLLVQQPKTMQKIVDAFRAEMHDEREGHKDEVKAFTASVDAGFARIDTRLAVEEIKRENREADRKLRG